MPENFLNFRPETDPKSPARLKTMRPQTPVPTAPAPHIAPLHCRFLATRLIGKQREFNYSAFSLKPHAIQ